MKKLKHSKYKNTGIIFEILTRHIVQETLGKRGTSSMSIIRKFFSEGTELHKELKYYQTLQEMNTTIKNPDKLIDLVIETYNKRIDQNKLAAEKYRLIGEIRKHHDIDKFFSHQVSNYKLLASIYKIFEHSASENPSDHMNCRDTIVEHITGLDQSDNILTEVQTVWRTENPDIRKLAYKIIVEKFNEKYQNLNPKQKALLSKFINEDTNTESFRDYVYTEVANVRKKLSRLSKTITSEVMRIKLNEAIHLMDMIVSSKTIKNEHLSAMLKYYELIEELS